MNPDHKFLHPMPLKYPHYKHQLTTLHKFDVVCGFEFMRRYFGISRVETLFLNIGSTQNAT